MNRLYVMLAVLTMLVATAFAADPVFVTTADSLADTLNEGDAYADTVEATDADSADTVTYALLSGPAGLTVDPATGAIAWTPVQDEVGDNDIAITAADLAGGTDTLSVTVTVLNVDFAPVFTDADSMTDTVYEDAALSDQAVATDADGDPVVYALLDGPADLVLDTAGGQISWTPDNDDVGDHTVSIAVTDSTGLADTLTYTLTVVNVNDKPMLDASVPMSPQLYALATDSISFSVTVTDVDAGDVITYSWTVDGTELGTADAFTYAPGAETTVSVVLKATDGSTDTITITWTAVYAAVFSDSLIPAVTAAEHFTRGTNDLGDDELIVTFSQDIDDASIAGLFARDVFGIEGQGDLGFAGLSTGATANDNQLTVTFAADDTIPAQSGDLLILADGVLRGMNLVPATADTDSIVSYRVRVNSTGTEYTTITAAHAAAADNDSIIVTDGIFAENISLKTLTLAAAPGARPVIRYSGTGANMVTNSSYGVRPVISGFELDGISAADDTVGLIISAANFKIYDCILHDAGSQLINAGSLVQDCELYNAGTGVYNRVGSAKFIRNRIHDCGTALYFYAGDTKLIEHNQIYDNGTAVYLREVDDPVFTGNLIHHNTTVLNLYTSYAAYRLNWIGNTITANQQHGLTIFGGRGATVQHNVLFGNGLQDPSTYFDLRSINTADVTEDVTYNLIGTWNGNLDAYLASPQALGNKLDKDPSFADSADYHLGILSAATDAGNELSGDTDYDGSVRDFGAYGGDDPFDTAMPARLDTFTLVRADSIDSLTWSESIDDDLAWYVIARINVDSGLGNAGDGELVDTINVKAQTALAVSNAGSKWLYTIQVMDSSGYGGGFKFAYSTTGGEIVVIPDDAIDFGNVTPDSTEYRLVVLGNAGVADLTVSDVSMDSGSVINITDTAGASLSLPLVLAPGENYIVALGFTADTIYDISDHLTIRSDDGDAADTMIVLDVVAATALEEASISPTTISYGTEVVGVQSNRVYFYISNVGTAPLDVDSIYYADGTHFLSTTSMASRTIQVSGSYRMSTYCTPQDTGALSDTLYVRTSDPHNPILYCVVSATGTVPAITVSPTDSVFGPVQVGDTSDVMTVSIRNTGTADLVVDSVMFTDGSVMAYTDSLALPITISSGGSQNLSCIYTPVDSSVVTDTLLIYSSDPATPVARVVLTGSGPVSIHDGVPTAASVRLTVGSNPAVNGLTLHFGLADAGRMNVDLWDASGLHVMQLASRVFPAGGNTVRWSGDLAPGQYLVTVEGNGIWYTAQVTVSR